MTIKLLNKYLPLLQLITRKNISRQCFVSLVQSLDEEAVKFFCECVQNAISVKYVSQLNKRQKTLFLKRILPNRRVLKHLCKKTQSYKHQRKIISQKGYGFIIPILSAVIPLIASLLSSKRK